MILCLNLWKNVFQIKILKLVNVPWNFIVHFKLVRIKKYLIHLLYEMQILNIILMKKWIFYKISSKKRNKMENVNMIIKKVGKELIFYYVKILSSMQAK